MNRQEATIESQKIEIKRLQRDLETTQDTLNNWMKSILIRLKVSTTSVSLVRRVTEPAISHLPQARGDPELFQLREQSVPKAAPKLAAAPTSEQLEKLHMLHPIHPFLRLNLQFQQSQSLIIEDPKKREATIDKSTSKAKSLILRNIPGPLCYGLVKLRMPNV